MTRWPIASSASRATTVKALVFSWENLDNAAAAYSKLIAKIAALKPEDGAVDEAVLKEYKDKFLQQLGNDLNTSMASPPCTTL